MSAADRDWSDLSPKLLGSIAERLSAEDYLRFGAVCTSWASAASPQDGLVLPLGPQMPRLLLLGDEGERGESCTLVSLPERRCHRIAPFPELRGKRCVGSQDGWLAVLDERSEVSLLNLLTREQIRLPSVTTIAGVNPVYNSDGSLKEFLHNSSVAGGELLPHTPPEFSLISFRKVVLSSRPTSGSYTAMAIFGGYNEPAFATAGGEKWTHMPMTPSFTDIIYWDGKFLGISSNGELWAFDLTGPSPERALIAKACDPKYYSDDKYLVDSSGDLLQVWRSSGDESYMTQTIDVFKFDPEHAAWVPLKSLGDRSLFLGLCYSISLSAREIPKLKPNRIYYTEVLWDGLPEEHRYKLMTRDVFVFSLEDGSFDRYEPPDPRFNWPPPIWVAPGLL